MTKKPPPKKDPPTVKLSSSEKKRRARESCRQSRIRKLDKESLNDFRQKELKAKHEQNRLSSAKKKANAMAPPNPHRNEEPDPPLQPWGVPSTPGGDAASGGGALTWYGHTSGGGTTLAGGDLFPQMPQQTPHRNQQREEPDPVQTHPMQTPLQPWGVPSTPGGDAASGGGALTWYGHTSGGGTTLAGGDLFPQMPQQTPHRNQQREEPDPVQTHPMQTPLQFEIFRTPRRGAASGGGALILSGRTSGRTPVGVGGTTQRGGDVFLPTPQEAIRQVFETSYLQEKEMAGLFIDGFKDGIKDLATGFRDRSHAAESQARLLMEYGYFSQGGGNDGNFEYSSHLSDRLLGSATTKTGTPDSEKKMPARESNHSHGADGFHDGASSTTSSPVAGGFRYDANQQRIVVANTASVSTSAVARAHRGSAPPAEPSQGSQTHRASTNTIVAAGEERPAVKTSKQKGAKKKPPTPAPSRRSSRLKGKPSEDKMTKKTPAKKAPAKKSRNRTHPLPILNDTEMKAAVEEEEEEETIQAEILDTMDSVARPTSVPGEPFTFRPPTIPPTIGNMVSSVDFLDPRLAIFTLQVLPTIDESIIPDDSNDHDDFFVSVEEEEEAYRAQHARNERERLQRAATMASNAAAAANMEVPTVNAGVRTHTNNWGTTFDRFFIGRWQCSVCRAMNADSAVQCSACETNRPGH